MKQASFYTPVVTALNEDGSIDIEANKAIWDFLIEGGIDGLVIMGSTGEFFSMTESQKKQIVDLAAAHINGRTKLYIGTGR